MKITLEIDCEIDGEWKPEYEDDVITRLGIDGGVSCGTEEDGCHVIFNTIDWSFRDMDNIHDTEDK